MDSIACVRFKPSVLLDPLTPALARILGALDTCARRLNVDLTVTCGRESHGLADPHTLGAAVDVRTRTLTAEQTGLAFQYLRATLGERWTVLYEVPARPEPARLAVIATVNPHATGPHFHIQARKGTVYPPQDAVSRTVDTPLDA